MAEPISAAPNSPVRTVPGKPAQADGAPVVRGALAIARRWRLEAEIDRMTGRAENG